MHLMSLVCFIGLRGLGGVGEFCWTDRSPRNTSKCLKDSVSESEVAKS
jgi:hypothetical protein